MTLCCVMFHVRVPFPVSLVVKVGLRSGYTTTAIRAFPSIRPLSNERDKQWGQVMPKTSIKSHTNPPSRAERRVDLVGEEPRRRSLINDRRRSG